MQKKRFSISVKMFFLIVGIILLVSSGLVLVSYRVYSDHVNSLYFEQAERAANAVKGDIMEHVVLYLWDMINTEEFHAIREEAVAANDEDMIRNWMISKPGWDIRNMNPDHERVKSFLEDDENKASYSLYGDYLYLIYSLSKDMELFDIDVAYIQRDENGVTWNLADPLENLLYVGSIEEPIAAFAGYGDNAYIPPMFYKSPFGWLCTVQKPIGDSDGGPAFAVIGVDTDMNKIVESREHFLVNSAIYVISITIISILISLFFSTRIVVHPLGMLSKATRAFATGDEEVSKDEVIDLPIDSRDEIEDLYRDIRSMQMRIVGYIENMKRITSERERVNAELNTAEHIQRGMLPASFPAFPDHTEFDLFALMDPARVVGGDFYDFFLLDETHLALVIADVSDKGVPAALFMMSSMMLIRSCSKQGRTPAEILKDVNDRIDAFNRYKMFVTVWMGILDLESGMMTCANAGHEYPFIRGADGQFRLYRDKHGMVIGGLPISKYTDYELKIEPGGAVFVYTDGIPEANDTEGRFYGLDRLDAALNRSPDDPPKEIIERIREDTGSFMNGARQFDDITMLCVEYHGKGHS